MSLAEAVRRRRLECVLSQAELAERAGTTRGTVARIEAGGYLPRPSTLRRLAEALGVPAGALVTPEELDRRGKAA